MAVGAPANVVVLGLREGHLASLWAGPINHADVLVRFANPVDIEKAWRNQGTCTRLGRRRALSYKFHFKAALFSGFAHRGLFRIFFKLDMTSDREPFVQFAMVNEQDFTVLNDEYSDRKVDLLMDVSHAARSVVFNRSFVK